ncbi:hypothetical protein F2Q69_00005035 [Brassica cretica]|uniref:Uncharacterized protein n=1 Tax=Brassica cretica TaxID=69181 RepID=A0A8S9PDZ2_BRACR|nr:hypothetical protein F2Q69_00005035 [Brassica cretica]
MPSNIRSNKESQLIFSPDPASLESMICKEARSLSTGNNTSVSLDSAQPPSTLTPVPSTDSRSPLSIDNTNLPSTDTLHPISIDIPSRTSIDTVPRDMVAPLILVRDNNGVLHDQEGHLRNVADDFWHVVKEENLQEGDFEAESLMSFGGSHWYRSTPATEHRPTYTNSNRSTGVPEHRSKMPTESTASCNAVKILTHEEFAAKHPHPPSPDKTKYAYDEYDEDFEEERAIEYRAILDEEDKLSHHSSWKWNAPSFDMTSLPSIDTQPQQQCRDRASTDTAAYPSIDTDLNRVRDGDYSIGSWADEHHHESFAVETVTYTIGADKLKDSYTDEELLNMQKRDDTYQDPNGFVKAIDGRTLHVSREDIADILQTADGADNMFMHQRSNREQKTTKEFYDTAGGIENNFKQRFRHKTHPSINTDVPMVEEKDEYGVYRDDCEFARDLDGHTILVHTKDIRRLMERASRDEPVYICLPVGEGREAARRRFRGRKFDEFRRVTLVSIDTNHRALIDKHQPKSIDRSTRASIDNVYGVNRVLQCQANIDRQPSPPIDRRAPITYRVQMPKIDVAQLNALRPKPKPSEQPPEPVRTPSDDGDDPMEEDRVSTGRTLRRRKEKEAKHLKRGANEKEKENFRKRVFRIPLDKPFEEAYYSHKLIINDPGIIAACHCGAEYESDYSESIDTDPVPSIDKSHQKSTNTTYYKSVNTDFNRVRDGDYSIGSWADEPHHDSFAAVTVTYTTGADKLHDSFTDEELLNMQKREDTDQFQAEAAWGRTRFSQSIDTRHQQSIDKLPQQSININNTTSIDNHPIPNTTVSEKYKLDNQYLTPEEFGIFRNPNGYAKAIDGRTLHVSREDIADILQTANGADNLFTHQRRNREQKTTKEFYDTAGGIDNSFKQRYHHTTHPSINTDVPTVATQSEFSRRAFDLYGNIRFYWEENDQYGDYRDDQGYARDLYGTYICFPEHASQFTQTKLVPKIYTKDEINEMFYGYKLANYFHEGDEERHSQNSERDRRCSTPSIDSSQSTSIDRHHHTSIDNHFAASIDSNPSRPHTMKSQPNFHTREEIAQLVEGIYRALETTEERLNGRCDDIYFPMDLTISALNSKVKAIQRELVEIQSYIARRPEAPISIDRHNNKSIDTISSASIGSDTNRGRLVPKTTSDMSNTPYHGKEISADTYAALTRHQFKLESLGERLPRIGNKTAAMKDKWRRGDEAMRDLTGDEEGHSQIQNAIDVARPTSIDSSQSPSIDRHHHTSIDNRLAASIDINLPRPHTMKSQPDSHTREEIDQLVEGIYRALETTEERLDGRCDDIYFPMDLTISALTSKVEAIQGELVEIQSYIAH